jgi:hypothetical protein
MQIKGCHALRKARRSHYARRCRNPSLSKAVAGSGKILSDGNVALSLEDGSIVNYQVIPVVGYRVVPVVNRIATIFKIARAVEASFAEALAVAGLPADAQIDLLPLVNTVFLALDGKNDGALIKRMADEAAYLAVERIIDATTLPIAAE